MRLVTEINVNKNTAAYRIKVPKQCPYCATVIRPIYDANLTGLISFNGNTLFIVVLRAPCCERHFACTYEIVKGPQSQTPVLLQSYPSPSSAQIPEVISDMSPRFAQLYGHSHAAEMSNHIELAGSGYRNALEVLIKDYAISKLGRPREEVVKKTLDKAIEAYVPTVNLKNCADVIRILGNDYTHYESRYDSIDFDILKKYMLVFITALEADLLMREPVIDTRRSQQQPVPQPVPATAP